MSTQRFRQQEEQFLAQIEQLEQERQELQQQLKQSADLVMRMSSHVSDRQLLIDSVPKKRRDTDDRIPRWQLQIDQTREQISLHRTNADILRRNMHAKTCEIRRIRGCIADLLSQREQVRLMERRTRKIPVLP